MASAKSSGTPEGSAITLKPTVIPAILELNDLVGRFWFFRTVTYHLIGRVERLIATPHTIIVVLSDASWVADSGRFANAIAEGTLAEVEPTGDAFLNLAAVTDFFPWHHPAPTQQI